MKFVYIMLIFSILLLLISNIQPTEDEIIQEKITIIEMAEKTPTPETLAMANKAKQELSEIEEKRQNKIQSEKEKQEFNEKASNFGSKEFWQAFGGLSMLMLVWVGAIFLAFRLWHRNMY